jgi:[ribosomal protein S5]-alanine N-acetyltransferase
VPPRASRLDSLAIPIETKRLRLERPSLRRLKEYRPLLNDRAVSQWLLRVPWPYHRADARAYILRSVRGRRAGTDLLLAIVERESGRLIGGIGLHHLDWEHHNGELGYWLGRPYWGRGYGTEAAEAIVRIGFEQLHLHRLDAGLFRGNSASEHLLRKLGFAKEGLRRESFRKRGVWKDDLLFGLLEREWGRARPRRARRARMRSD